MTAKEFFNWQTLGGADDVTSFVDCLEKANLDWCTIGGIAVNHWAAEAMVTQDLDFAVTADSVGRVEKVLTEAGFAAERFQWSINFKGKSKISIQLSTEAVYSEFPARGVAADVHGILLRVASLEDTLAGKIMAWSDTTRRQSKRIKDLADIARLVESHPELWHSLKDELKKEIDSPYKDQQ